MIGFLLFIITIGLLIIFSIFSTYVKVFSLSRYQRIQMTVSTILLIAFGFMRGFLLEADLQTTANDIFIFGFFYLIWYFTTYFLTNLINSVEDPSAKMRQSQYHEIAIATILFFVLFGYWHTILTGKEVNSNDIVLTTLLFGLWYFISVEMANRFM